MKQKPQELNKSQPHSIEHVAVLGMANKRGRKSVEPKLIYKTVENPDFYKLDNAFDILFEETLRQMGHLTTYDN